MSLRDFAFACPSVDSEPLMLKDVSSFLHHNQAPLAFASGRSDVTRVPTAEQPGTETAALEAQSGTFSLSVAARFFFVVARQ